MTADDSFKKLRFGSRNALDRLAGHGFGQKPDEVAGMSRLHRDTDFAVRLEAADAGTMAGARIDDDERPPPHVDRDILGRDDADERVVDRLVEFAAVRNQLGSILQHMRCGLRDVLAILVAALSHDIQKQHAPLSGIDQILHGGGDQPRHGTGRQLQIFHRNLTSLSCEASQGEMPPATLT
ncbi:hypothetical protein ABIF60_004300 [Bradyrhizobium japonicum]